MARTLARSARLALLATAVLAFAAPAQEPIFGVELGIEEGWTRLLKNPEVSSAFRVRAPKSTWKAGEELTLEVDFRIQTEPEEWYLEGPLSENAPLRFESSADPIEILGVPEGPKGKVVVDPLLDGKKIEKHFGEITFQQRVRVRGDAKGGKLDFEIKVRGQSCKEGSCDMIRGVAQALQFEITPDEKAAAAEPAYREAAAKRAAEAAGAAAKAGAAVGTATTSLLGFLIFCFLGGLAMLLLPCIWPMIPITVSYFTKQSENRRSGATSLALIYGFGIVFTYALIGFVTSVWLGPKAAQDFATHAILNLAIGVLFVVFALSFFGMFELTVPAFIQERLNRATGGGSAAGHGRIAGTLLLGAMFTVTSFACSAPVMASIWAIGFTSGGGWWIVPLGMAVAAVAVSLPFVLLALFPSLMKSLPRSGGWMNTVKAFLGFVELAAALKFFSNADLKWDLQLLTWPVFMAMLAAIAFATTLYLFGLIKLLHEDPSGQVSAPRMTTGVVTGTFGLYLLVGMFTAEPMPDWVTSFVPAKYYGRPHLEQELTWIEDWDEIQLAAKDGEKPIFLDFTGVNCTNCRLVEESVFPRVTNELEKFVLGRLFTDVGERQDEYDAMKVAFGSYGLPYYVILSPDGKTKLASSEYERDVPTYRKFLERGLAAAAALPKAELEPDAPSPVVSSPRPEERDVPAPTHGGANGEPASLVWYDDLEQARKVAQQSGKRLFLDFTGNACRPCRLMEKKVFPEAAVQEQFQRYVLVKLITDDPAVPGADAKQAYLRSINDGSDAIPLYAVEEPGGKLIEKVSGLQELQVFVDFLKRSAGSGS